jgi:hypothetical protein
VTSSRAQQVPQRLNERTEAGRVFHVEWATLDVPGAWLLIILWLTWVAT